MFGLGWPEAALIILVVIVIFGPKKFPEIGAALGKTLLGFKRELQADREAEAEEDDPA